MRSTDLDALASNIKSCYNYSNKNPMKCIDKSKDNSKNTRKMRLFSSVVQKSKVQARDQGTHSVC